MKCYEILGQKYVQELTRLHMHIRLGMKLGCTVAAHK